MSYTTVPHIQHIGTNLSDGEKCEIVNSTTEDFDMQNEIVSYSELIKGGPRIFVSIFSYQIRC